MNNDPVNNNFSPEPPKETKTCPRCGRELPADATFCGECGLHLSADGVNTPYTLPPQTAVPADTSPLKTTDYLVLLVLSSVPVVGLILMLIWAFSSESNVNRRNFCRAQLIWIVISLAVSLIFALIYGVIFASLFESIGSSASAFDNYYGMIFR